MENNIFDKYFDDLAERTARRTAAGVLSAPQSPENMAEAVTLSRETGAPAEVVVGAPDVFRSQAAQQRASTALQGAPLTSAWVRDPVNAALSQDDLDNLTLFEREFGPAGRAIGRGARRVSSAPDYMGAVADATRAGDVGKSLDELIAEETARVGGQAAPAASRANALQVAQMRYDAIAGQGEAERLGYTRRGSERLASAQAIIDRAAAIPMSDTATAFRDGTLAAAENTFVGTLKAFIQDPVGGAAFIAETAAETVPILAAATATTIVTRSPGAGAIAMGSGSFLQENTLGAMDFLAEQGVDISAPEAALAVMSDANLLAQAQERGVTRGLIVAVFDAVSGGVAGQTLMSNPAGDMATQGIAQALMGGGGEATAQLATTGEIDAREVVIEGLAEFATAPIEVVGVGGRGLVRQFGAYARGSEARTLMDRADEMASGSKLLSRDAATFEGALEAQGVSDGQLYIGASDVREYFQAKDVDIDDETLLAWGINPESFAEADAAGADVSIPISRYITRIRDTEHADWFKDNASLDPEAMSAAQAEAFNQEVSGIMQDAFEAAEAERKDNAEVRASDVQIHDAVFEQLRAAGRTKDVADHEARVWASFWRTLGQRYGADPLELAQSMGVNIQGPTSDVARVRGDLDLQLNTLRSQGDKALAPRGRSLMDFVRDEGGIQDVGGDLAAMDTPSGVIAETRETIQERRSQPSLDGSASAGSGIGMDEMGRRAIEAGYFPQLVGGADKQADGTVIDEAAVLLDALTRAVRGDDTFIDGEGPDADLQALSDDLSERGIDLSQSNDEIAAALEDDGRAGGGTHLSQSNSGSVQSYSQTDPLDPRTEKLGIDPDFVNQRGSIRLPSGGLTEGQTIISLFEGADLSTFLHESGHFFLEAFTALAESDTAPQEMRDDLDAIRKFVGLKEGEPYETAHHEKWARGFEAYMMEGKAPSLGLADSFARFKSWLTRIYRSMKGLNVKITPEIREVMDRMLATDDELAAVRDIAEASPLFSSQSAAGMSDAAWTTYQRMARRSEEQASQALLERAMERVRRERQAWWKSERAQVRKEVEAAVTSRREYRLVEMLANGRWIGSDRDVPDMRLNRKELVEAFGDGVLAEVSRSRIGGKRAIYGDDGSSLREVSEFFGFESPSQMVSILQNTIKRVDAIEQETDAVMLDRYGDPMTDGSIEEEALAAIHNDQRSQTLASEVRHLAARAGRPTRNMSAKVYRQRARLMLEGMTVADAIRPDSFLAAERRAAKRAEGAFARSTKSRGAGEALSEAAKYKEQQLLNHYLYMEARDLKKRVEGQREKMRRYSKKSVREKLAGDYIAQIDALLEGFDFRQRSRGQVDRSTRLNDFVERMKAEGRESELAIDERLMVDAARKHYSRMTTSELNGLFDTIANIDHMGRHKQALIEAKQQRDLDEVASRVVGAMNDNVSGSPPGRTETPDERRRKFGRDYLNSVLNADTLLREVDGFEDMGPAWSAMKSSIDAGMNRVVERRRDMAEAFDGIYGVYSGKEKRQMSVKKQNDALGGMFSKWDLISLALNTGNQGNFERLTNTKTPGHFQQASIEAALADLDDRDWKTVQAIWDYIDSFWGEISAKEKRQTGLEPEKVETRQMVTAPGFVRGGYYPVKYDSRLSGLADDFQQKDLAESLIGGRFGKAQTRNGHTKERAQTTRQPVQLDLSVAHTHVEQVIYDLEIGEAAASSWKILHHPQVRDAFVNKGRQSDFNALELWLQDVAAGERIAAGGLQTVLRHIRSGFTVSRLALNVSTALIQPTGLVQSAVLVGKRAVATGTIDYVTHMGRWVSDVKAVSPMMRERQLTFERDIFNVVGDLEGGPVSGWQKFQRDVILPVSFLLMQKVQYYTVDMPTWVSAYQKEVKAGGDEVKAREFADLMVKRAQGSGLMSDRGMLERGTLNASSRQQEFPRMLTALGSYMFAKGNVAYERASQTDFKNPVEVMALASDIVLLFTIEAVLYSAVKGYLPGDDEDEPEEIAGWLAKETAFSMMSTLPVARELSGAMQGFGGGGIFGSGVEVLARPFIQAGQGEYDKALVKSLVDAGGVMLHLPSSQSRAVLDAFFDDDMTIRKDISPVEALGVGKGDGRSMADLFFED